MNIDPDDENWLNFFDMYKSLPVLWDSQHEGFKSILKREHAWRILLQAYKRIDSNATLDRLKYKVHNLRCAYRRELKKVERSKWEDPDSYQVPQLWSFEHLDFLRNQPNTPIDFSSTDSVEKEDSDYEHRNKRMKIQSSRDNDDRFDTGKFVKLAPKRLEEYQNQKPKDKDESEVYGEGWACCFRKLTEEQQLYAKKVIDEVLVLAQLEKLTVDTKVASSAYLSGNLVAPFTSVMLTSQPPYEEYVQDENILYESHNYAKKEFYCSTGPLN